MTLLLVCLGAGLGAPARYLVERAVQRRTGATFPLGTLVVNVVGSLVLGVLIGVASTRDVAPALLAALGTGFCGALTTYSSFGLQSVELVEVGERRLAAVNVGVSLVVGLAAASLGWMVGRAL